jgi:protoheme IX farnesyltransferase
MQQTIKAYYRLTKPGIIYGNVISSIAGFLLASQGHVNWRLLLATLAGISLVIASACVFNNYIDQGLDVKMARTKQRALVTGQIHGPQALLYATALGLLGFAVLVVYTNALTVYLGVLAIFVYVVLYGWAKRHTVHGTIVGSVAGALPPAAGYTAVSGQFDTGAWLLFLIMTFWQIPHFYAIALYRLKDYANAGLPVLPVKRGIAAAKRQIVGYIVAYLAVASSLTVFGYTSSAYLIIMIVLGLSWLWLALKQYRTAEPARWARRLFFFSLLVMLGWSATISIDSFFH